MDAGVIVAIVIGALALLIVLTLVAKRGRESRRETRRNEAVEIRREGEVRSARADGARAEAEERSARARREQAVARERAARAEVLEGEAEEHRVRAADVDPDGDSDVEPAQSEPATRSR
jgi:hypothetical protein